MNKKRKIEQKENLETPIEDFISRIPIEILKLIFVICNINDNLSLSCCCKLFQKVFDQSYIKQNYS